MDLPGLCGDFLFAVNKRYLVYTYKRDPRKQQQSNFPEFWTTSDCTPNLEAENAAEEMKKLDEIVKKPPR